jgi:lipoprotein-anchoring transpeptidase ErfK/SrfK
MKKPALRIKVSIRAQRLDLLDGDTLVKSYSVATAKNGPGEMNGSECTPRGGHVIRAKVGGGAQANTVFVKRRPTGEVFASGFREQFPKRDWILTRILWLSGTEPGKNRFGNVDTMRRYIYIHGCPDEDQMGIPSSHGCVKMRNADVIDLFERVSAGTPVLIEA